MAELEVDSAQMETDIKHETKVAGQDANAAEAMTEEAFAAAERGAALIRKKRVTRKFFEAFKAHWEDQKARKAVHEGFAEKFHAQGMLRRSTKAWRTFVFGKVGTEAETMRRRSDLLLNAELEQREIQIKFLEDLIKQNEEIYKIELSKKALMRNDYDDLAKRTSEHFSQEALALSLSTLKDLQPKI